MYVLCFNLDSLTRKAFCLMLNLYLLSSALLYNSVMGIMLSASKIGLENRTQHWQCCISDQTDILIHHKINQADISLLIKDTGYLFI